MKQLSRAFTLGFACSLVVGVMAGQSALASVADLSGSWGSSPSTTVSISAPTSSVSTVTVSPSEVTSYAPHGWGWSPPPPPPPICPVPEANAGFVLAALFPLMLLITPARVRKVIAAFRAGGTVDSAA